jgi:predicted RecA/RadA family phage recombinase
MRNFVQPGRTITIPAPFTLEPGYVVIVGDLAGVSAGAAETGAPADIVLEGVFQLAKESAAVLTVGELALWDGNRVVNSESEGDAIGHVVEAAGVGVTTVKVRLSN